MKKTARLLFPIGAALLFLLTMRHAAAAAQGVRTGLQLAFGTAVPALLPFFVAGSLLTDSGAAAALGRLLARPLRRLYGVGGAGAAALVLGLTGGYPVGAKTVCSLYAAGQLSSAEAERLLGFCNNTGPAFILGVAGIGVCGSARTGLALYGIHAASALLTGLLLPRRPLPSSRSAPRPALPPPRPLAACTVDAIQQGFQTSLLVAAFITGASLLLALLHEAGLFALLGTGLAPLLHACGLPPALTDAVLSGMTELTCGLMQLPGLALHRRALLPILSFLIAFGGLSVHCQTLALTEPAGLNARLHTRGKLLHGVLAAVLTRMLLAADPAALPVFSVCASAPVSRTLPAIWNYVFFFLLLVSILLTFNDGKHRGNRL